ncbi:hypothetical protein C5167_051005 [Papaver somniferum]|uniref:Uncharacterized protein n=1 Tax=Papaver somniferum TaxID=3469 RepID=A0A4Y7KQ83_PAPSO|nr:hypothetical protein C5167_051005 [Papaver somniferum]
MLGAHVFLEISTKIQLKHRASNGNGVTNIMESAVCVTNVGSVTMVNLREQLSNRELSTRSLPRCPTIAALLDKTVSSFILIPVSMGATFFYQAVGLHRGGKVIAFVGADRGTNWRVYQVGVRPGVIKYI